MSHSGGANTLYGNGHFEPEGNVLMKEECCNTIGALISGVSPGVVFGADLNTHRTGTSLITRLLRRVQCLAALHLDYPPRQTTNVTWAGGSQIITEMDYLMASKNLRVSQLDLYIAVCTHRVMVADVTGFVSVQFTTCIRRYKPEQVQEVAGLRTLCWW